MSILKAIKKTSILPISVVRDVVTLGGVFEDKDEPNTVTNLKKIMEEIEEVLDE